MKKTKKFSLSAKGGSASGGKDISTEIRQPRVILEFVGRDEFILLEKRVIALEKRSSK